MSIQAETLMTNRFLRISTAHSLREALGLILYGEERKMEIGAIVVIDPEGEFAGLLTPYSLAIGLVDLVSVGGQESNEALLESINRHLPELVDKVVVTELPLLTPTTSLSELILRMGAGQHECLPVLEEKRVVGLVYATDVFKAAAKLALTPGQEGINLNR